ncbi:uncharacterized protein LOC112163846 [Rosa chinensis]|uniref:uncharacterized protein LOC112163846 n=1 Tax=Rosa chinensis TaxID=74649 RepID=UPI000D0894F7|nr:uncharacterized protein LOC112163846 [Rosa chinensis]
MNAFRQALLDCNLADLGVASGPFRWSDAHTKERLDRVVGSSEWQGAFGFSRVVNLPPSISNDVPMLLEVRTEQIVHHRGRRQFRFEEMWCSHEAFTQVVEEAWTEPQNGSPIVQVCRKIKDTGKALLDWDITTFKSRREELASSQRSRAIWLKDGDRNFKFFHQRASNRKQKNKIKGLFDDNGVWQTSSNGIEDVVMKYFQQVYASQAPDVRAQEVVLQTIVSRVTIEMNELLLAPYSMEEVRNALFQMHPSEAPGLDGMSPFFFQKYWDLVGSELRRGQEGFLALKLDITKAYDRLEWDFLRKIMLKMGFASQWVDLIMFCLSTVQYSFLINGIPSGFVTPHRKLRQGDPISPYLFLLCAEGLSTLISHFVANGQWQELRVCDGAPIISHLLFADDSMLYSNASSQDCILIRNILNVYERASGQKINLQKSSVVFSRSVPSLIRQSLADNLDVQVVDKHEKYLGIPTLGDETKLASEVVPLTLGWWEEFKVAHSPSRLASPIQNVRWTKPPIGMIKLNVDVAFSNVDGSVGVGGVFRDFEGSCLGGFRHTLPTASSAHHAKLVELLVGV